MRSPSVASVSQGKRLALVVCLAAYCNLRPGYAPTRQPPLWPSYRHRRPALLKGLDITVLIPEIYSIGIDCDCVADCWDVELLPVCVQDVRPLAQSGMPVVLQQIHAIPN